MSNSDGLRWIAAGKSDLAAAHNLFEDSYYHLCAFHAQQAVEKSLKGWLRLLNHIPWGHSCFDLLSQAGGLLAEASQALEDARNLVTFMKKHLP